SVLRRIFPLLERTALLRGARCFGAALAQNRLGGRRFLQGIDPGRRRVRSSAEEIRTSAASKAQQASASRGAFVPVGGEKSGELRALAPRAGCGCVLPAFESIRRSNRRVRLQNKSLVTGYRAEGATPVASGLRPVFSNLFGI